MTGSTDASDTAELLDRLDALIERLDALAGTAGDTARSLAETLYLVHRSAVGHLADALGEDEVERLSAQHPAISWLFEVYRVDLDALREDASDRPSTAPPPGARVLPVVSAAPRR